MDSAIQLLNNWDQAEVARRAETLIQRINRCPAIRKTDVLSFGNLDKTPIDLMGLMPANSQASVD